MSCLHAPHDYGHFLVGQQGATTRGFDDHPALTHENVSSPHESVEITHSHTPKHQ
nr:MAG TPA: hypothetical protein [Caudoviricetes sp.]